LLIICQIFRFTIGVRQLQVCRKFTTKFTTFVRVTSFVNSTQAYLWCLEKLFFLSFVSVGVFFIYAANKLA